MRIHLMGEARICPCGSGQDYSLCCGVYHSGQNAPTAEKLMRSRYSAYVLGKTTYLLQTWHNSTRPESLNLDANAAPAEWLGLNIISCDEGDANDLSGTVEFVAHYHSSEGARQIHERSRFVREAGQWFYIGGEFPSQQKKVLEKIGRNAKCPCGSGVKFKRCCGR